MSKGFFFEDTSVLFSNRQMEGVEPIDQARRAIAHVLGAIRDDVRKYDLLGLGTQSYELLTEAAATLWDKPVEEVRRMFIPEQLRGDDKKETA